MQRPSDSPQPISHFTSQSAAIPPHPKPPVADKPIYSRRIKKSSTSSTSSNASSNASSACCHNRVRRFSFEDSTVGSNRLTEEHLHQRTQQEHKHKDHEQSKTEQSSRSEQKEHKHRGEKELQH